MATRSAQPSLRDPSRLKPFAKGDETIRVVIETPKGSRNKYAFDPDDQVFVLKKVLPTGMAFPYDFGFVPSTRAEDRDPVDVLVLMDEPAFAGCVLKWSRRRDRRGRDERQEDDQERSTCRRRARQSQLRARQTHRRPWQGLRGGARGVLRELPLAVEQPLQDHRRTWSTRSPSPFG